MVVIIECDTGSRDSLTAHDMFTLVIAAIVFRVVVWASLYVLTQFYSYFRMGAVDLRLLRFVTIVDIVLS